MARKTKKSDTLPGIPFEFDFYMVYWEDIQSDSGWRTLKEIQKSKPAITPSCLAIILALIILFFSLMMFVVISPLGFRSSFRAFLTTDFI